MKQELAVLTTSDLNAAGINSQLSSNDLVEVVAHDIYDKYTASIVNIIAEGDELYKRAQNLMEVEIFKMKKSLSKYLSASDKVLLVEDAEDEYEEEFGDVNASYSTGDEYWPNLSMSKIVLREKDKGTFVEFDSRNVRCPNLKNKSAKVKIVLSTPNISETQEVKQGNITGTIENTVKKTFTQVVSVPITRFKNIADEIKAYNKSVNALSEFLPKNGLLSVERFTREARVKMNKKIISAQSPDFRKKISELFNIKL